MIFGIFMAFNVGNAAAQVITEGFETAPPAGWDIKNNSSPNGSSTWFQGSPAVFTAQAGPTNSYIGANFNSTTGANTISNWLFPPSRTFSNGDVITFYTRVAPESPFPDRLQVRLSTTGGGTEVGATETSVGDFTTLLLDINPNLTVGGYPDQWMQFTITLSGLPAPTVGRLAFRYFVTNGGPTGDNSNFIGIDTFTYTPAGTPVANNVQFAPAFFSVAESAGTATITVTRTVTDGTTSVNYATANGSATGGASCTAGVDYISTNGTLTFAAGVASQTFPVTICDDAVSETAESVNLTLSNPSGGATLGTAATAILSIEASDSTATSGRSYDFFGNNLADFAVLSFPATGGGNIRWRVLRNDNPTSSAPGAATIFDIPWGSSATDLIPQVGDYDGNGVTDLSVYRSSEGDQANTYYTLPLNGSGNAPGNPVVQQLGDSTTDIIGAEGDYDGDGKMDYTVVRDTNGTDTAGGTLLWYVLKSSDNTFLYYYYGRDTDIALGGADYTGDGFDNPTVIRISGGGAISWLIGNSAGQVMRTVQWGSFLTDFVMPGGDYDGDGKADFMVWRGFGGTNGAAGSWYLLTNDGSSGGVIPFGIRGDGDNRDTPLRGGDYDGDGKDDIAVYRNSPTNPEMQFYIRRSSDGGLMTQKWGVPGNTNIPVAGFGTF